LKYQPAPPEPALGKKQGTHRSLRKTTEVMHTCLGRVVNELRQRLEWSQEELARAIGKHGGQATDHMTVSRWERGIDAPSPVKRMALGKIAAKHGHEDLADVFRAAMTAWRLVARLERCHKHRTRPTILAAAAVQVRRIPAW
jgi:transcriptional regulator with XRE-family HTH domain